MPANATDATTNNYKNTDIVFALNTVSPYVRIVHPAKAVGQNEVPYTTETHVVSNVLLDRGPGPPWTEKIWRFPQK